MCVGKSRVHSEQRVVLSEDRPRIVTKQRQRREPDAIFGSTRLGREASLVGALGALEIAEPSAHQPERVPGARVLRITPSRFRETRLGELDLAPSRRPHSSGSWAGRIVRCELGSSIVERQCLLVAVGELERMTELERRHRTSGPELLLERCGVALGATEITERAREPHSESPFELRLRLFREVLLEQLERLTILPRICEQHRFAGALPGSWGARPQADRQSQRKAGCAGSARAF